MPLVIFLKKLKFLAIFWKKMSRFCQFFDSQMAIFRRVRCRYHCLIPQNPIKSSYSETHRHILSKEDWICYNFLYCIFLGIYRFRYRILSGSETDSFTYLCKKKKKKENTKWLGQEIQRNSSIVEYNWRIEFVYLRLKTPFQCDC